MALAKINAWHASVLVLFILVLLSRCGGDAADPTSAIIDVGGVTTLSSTLRDGRGNVLTGRTVTWTSSDPTVASVPSRGDAVMVTGHGGGSTIVTATSEGLRTSTLITVNPNLSEDHAAGRGY